jgi:hypothetical protein
MVSGWLRICNNDGSSFGSMINIGNVWVFVLVQALVLVMVYDGFLIWFPDL